MYMYLYLVTTDKAGQQKFLVKLEISFAKTIYGEFYLCCVYSLFLYMASTVNEPSLKIISVDDRIGCGKILPVPIETVNLNFVPDLGSKVDVDSNMDNVYYVETNPSDYVITQDDTCTLTIDENQSTGEIYVSETGDYVYSHSSIVHDEQHSKNGEFLVKGSNSPSLSVPSGSTSTLSSAAASAAILDTTACLEALMQLTQCDETQSQNETIQVHVPPDEPANLRLKFVVSSNGQLNVMYQDPALTSTDDSSADWLRQTVTELESTTTKKNASVIIYEKDFKKGKKPFSGVRTVRYKCHICARYFTSLTNLDSHITLHSQKCPFVCSICDKGFEDADSLAIHVGVHYGGEDVEDDDGDDDDMLTISTHTNKVYQCGDCKMTFPSKHSFWSHACFTRNKFPRARHSPYAKPEKSNPSSKKQVCHICGNAFIVGEKFDMHMKYHEMQLPFVCAQCDQHFENDSKLAVHMRIHRQVVEGYLV